MPDASRLNVKALTYDELKQTAESFLNKWHRERTLPIPIEDIIDVRMGIDISCEIGVIANCEVDGFVNRKCTAIHVDVEAYHSKTPGRYRFTLAHELAHILLHKDILASLSFKTQGEWKRVYDSIPKEQHDVMEWQALTLGGLILVPGKELGSILDEERTALGKRATNPITRYTVENKLAVRFEVSREMIQRRSEEEKLKWLNAL